MEGTFGFNDKGFSGGFTEGGGGDSQPSAATVAADNHPQNMAQYGQTNWDQDSSLAKKESSSFRELFLKNLHSNLTYCGVFWSFGMCVAFLGPTLLDLGCVTASDMKTISWVFSAQLLWSLIGSVLAGFLAQRVDANLVLLVATSLIPIAMFLIPFAKAIVALGVILSIMGLNMGCIDCLANLQMIQIYGQAVAPFLQAMHFCYGLGAFVSPMIAEPFLLNEDCTPLIDHLNISHPTAAPGSLYENTTLPAETLQEAQEMTRVRYAFWCLCAVQLPIPFLVGSLVWKLKKKKPLEETDLDTTQSGGVPIGTKSANKSDYENIDKEKDDRPFWQPSEMYQHYRSNKFCGSSTSQVITITVATAAMLFIYDGLQSAYGAYVYTYALKSIVDLNKTEGAYLNACFWGCFALGRLFSIFFATRFAPAFMLLVNILGCLGSMILMLALSHNHVALYFGTCFFGIFLSSVTPTALSLAEQYIEVTSSITTFCVVIAALGEALFPAIVGNMFQSLGPSSLLGFGNITTFASVFLFALIWWIGRQTPKYKSGSTSSFVWYPMFGLGRGAAASSDEDGLVTTHVKYYTRMSESDSNIELANVAPGDVQQTNAY